MRLSQCIGFCLCTITIAVVDATSINAIKKTIGVGFISQTGWRNVTCDPTTLLNSGATNRRKYLRAHIETQHGLEGTTDIAIPHESGFLKIDKVWKDSVACVKGALAAIPCHISNELTDKGQQLINKAIANFVEQVNLVYYKILNFDYLSLIKLGGDPVFNLIRINVVFFLIDALFTKKYFLEKLAVVGKAVFYKGEYFRLFTSLFVHNDLVHLITNISSLATVGMNALEKLGTKRFLLIYVLSGLFANYCSYLYNFLYKNGVPVDAADIAKYLSLNATVPRKLLCSTSGDIYKQIMKRNSESPFNDYLLEYVKGLYNNVYNSLLSCMLGQSERSKPDPKQQSLEASIRNMCMTNTTVENKSAGASSSICGLQGAILAFYIRGGTSKDYNIALELLQRLALQNIWGLFVKGTDHLSHLSGLFTGFIMGLLL